MFFELVPIYITINAHNLVHAFHWLWVCGGATGGAESLTLCRIHHFKIRSSWALSSSRIYSCAYPTLGERVWKGKTASETQLLLPASKAHLCLVWHGLGKCMDKYCPIGIIHYTRLSTDLWSCMQLWSLKESWTAHLENLTTLPWSEGTLRSCP